VVAPVKKQDVELPPRVKAKKCLELKQGLFAGIFSENHLVNKVI
jgi:hypothetical protein